jgi:hypothetical protein
VSRRGSSVISISESTYVSFSFQLDCTGKYQEELVERGANRFAERLAAVLMILLAEVRC